MDTEILTWCITSDLCSTCLKPHLEPQNMSVPTSVFQHIQGSVPRSCNTDVFI